MLPRIKFITPLILGLIYSNQAFALTETITFECIREVSKDEAKRTLNHTQEAYGKLKTLAATFTQDSYLSALEISETSSGKVWFAKPGRMRWYYEKPEEQIFVIRDKTVWLYQVGEHQVIVDQFANILISDLPVAFLLGLGNLSRDFVLAKACEISEPKGILFELTPAKRGAKGADKGLERFDLVVDIKSSLPIGARIRDVGGNLNTIVMKGLLPDSPLEESLFKADFPSGTDIDDRRLSGVVRNDAIP